MGLMTDLLKDWPRAEQLENIGFDYDIDLTVSRQYDALRRRR